jgi:superfamily II DNA/RNA helicase
LEWNLITDFVFILLFGVLRLMVICTLLTIIICCCVCVQASSIPSVLSGKDVVIAAETGSGKTYSYLLPLIDKLRDTQEHSPDVVSDKEVYPPARKVLLVLCPNVQLCEQVTSMANSLCSDNGGNIVSVASICGRQVLML